MELLGSIVVLVCSVLVVLWNDSLGLEPGLIGMLIMWSGKNTAQCYLHPNRHLLQHFHATHITFTTLTGHFTITLNFLVGKFLYRFCRTH